MGYDVYITRALDYTLSESTPISWDDWMAAVDADPELQLSDTDYIEMRFDGSLETERIYDVKWTAHPEKPGFLLLYGAVQIKYPDNATLDKMEQIAQALNARVQAEGEIFDDYLATLPDEDEETSAP